MPKNLKKEEKKELKLLIRDLVELRKLIKAVNKVKKISPHKSYQKVRKKTKDILNSLRSRIFFGEERIEYKIVHEFNLIKEGFLILEGQLDDKQAQEIKKLISQAKVYNATLERLGARGGEIEKVLRKATKEPTNYQHLDNAEKLISGAIKADTAFEAVMLELIELTKNNKEFKSEKRCLKWSDDYAILSTDYYLVLYKYKVYRKLRKYYFQTLRNHPGRMEMKKYETTHNIQTPNVSVLGVGSRKLNYLEYKAMQEAVIGYCEFNKTFPKELFCGSSHLLRLAARFGLGNFFLELILSFKAKKHQPVIPDRKENTLSSRKLFCSFDNSRPDVLKYPASLKNYPKKIGFTKKKAERLFGKEGINSETFNASGFPINTSKEKIEKITSSKNYHQFVWPQIYEDEQGIMLKKHYVRQNEWEVKYGSYIETEGNNKLTRCLDKAYYFDKRTKLLDILIKRGNQDREKSPMYGQQPLQVAGDAFFQSFNPHRK